MAAAAVVAGALLAGGPGCLTQTQVACDDGVICPSPMVCAPAGGGCVDQAQLDQCEGQAEFAECAVPPLILDGICVGGVCDVRRCGDGYREPLEACDAGADNGDLGNAPCRADCTLPACGDGAVDDQTLGEVCDDGNTRSGDDCRADCRSDERCGNGLPDPGEACDDHNRRNRDGCTSGCQLEGLAWRPHRQGTPGARQGAAVTFDLARGRWVLHGGRMPLEGGGWAFLNDTWEFDGNSWIERRPAHTPPARYGAGAVYDSARQRVVMFGGQAVDPIDNVVWTWDGVDWRQEGLEGERPATKLAAGMAYDPARDRVVMFGGFEPGGMFDAETWEYDGERWHRHTPATSPSRRVGQSAAYDPIGGRVVLFGGYNDDEIDGGPQPGTWTWDGQTWTELPGDPDQPVLNDSGRLVFDGTRLLYTGVGATWPQVWALTGDDWTQLPAAAELPVPRRSPYLAFDPAGPTGPRVLMLGGETEVIDTFRDDLWQWRAGSWTELSPAPGPSARRSVAMAYDRVRARVVMFGGRDAAGPLDDTWEWDGASWRQLAPLLSPPERDGGAMACDPEAARCVLFGGLSAGPLLADTWEWDGERWAARTDVDGAPSPRMGAMMAFDEARRKVVLVGGFDGGMPGQTWELDRAGDDALAWRQVSTADEPPPVVGGALAFDAGLGEVVLMGGNYQADYSTQTWAYDGATWQNLRPVGDKFGLAYMASAYDPVMRRMVLFGGDDGAVGTADVRTLEGGAWLRRTDVQGAAPTPRVSAASAYDAARGQLLVFGGDDGTSLAPGALSDQTWLLAVEALDAGDLTRGEACGAGLDVDDDGARGCADDDCWGVCAPLCPPSQDAATCEAEPRCGDAVCAGGETCRSCADCVVGVDCDVLCGDGYCDDGEDAGTCPGDCGA